MTTHDDLVDGSGIRRFGRFSARPASVDPLAARSSFPRALRRLRLKQWVGWTLMHPDWACSMILQDAGYLATAELYVAERATGAIHQYAANARGGALGLPSNLFASRIAFHKKGFGLTYDLDCHAGSHRVTVDVRAHDGEPAVLGELVLDARSASSDLAVSARLPGGSMYTTKALFPVSGTLYVGGRRIHFDDTRDVAVLDEHQSILPYRTRWTWGTFAWHDADGLAGANFAARPSVPGQEEESGIWSPGVCEPLSDVGFVPSGRPGPGGAGALADHEDLDHPWTVRSQDRRLDVVFTPEGRKSVALNLGIVSMDYVQMFGRYRGTLLTQGTERTVVDVPGVLEEMRARL